MFLVFLVMFSYLTSGFPIDRCQVMPRRCLTIPDEPCPAKPQRKTRPVTIWNKQANIFYHGILSWCISITAATMIQMFMFPLFSYESLHMWFFFAICQPIWLHCALMIAMRERAQSMVQVLNKKLSLAPVLLEFSKQRWLVSQFHDQLTILVNKGCLIK